MASEAIHSGAQTDAHSGTHEEAHHELPARVEPDVITSELVASTDSNSTGVRNWMWILGIVTLVGIGVGFAKLLIEWGDQSEWGYTAAMVAFLFSVFGGAPLVAIAPTLAKANWVRPVARFAALCSLASIVCTIWMIPLILNLPMLVVDGARRRSIWFEGPDVSPHMWALVSMITLITAALGLIYAYALPDFAAMRDHSTGWKQRFGSWMARGWIGTTIQWRTLRLRIGMMGTLYFFTFVFVHFIISTDFAMSLVPGWRDAIFPMYHAISSIQAGLAVTVLGLWAARRYMGMDKYLHLDQFWSIGRLMFAFTLLWGYFFISAFIVYWYGRSGSDKMWIDYLILGPYFWVFILGVLFIWFTPWWWLIWNRVRRSYNGTAIGAGLILFGVFLDRVRLYVAAWAVPEDRIHERFLTEYPSAVFPDVMDLFIMVGALAGCVFVVLAATRVLPILSIWDVQQFNLLYRPVNYMKTKVSLIGKPD
ncbi:MAG: polysulfide reductase NrfD [Chloroflexi bacterium]|nr:polysulfide reductase NrfD [Chloroflexota bacterium]